MTLQSTAGRAVARPALIGLAGVAVAGAIVWVIAQPRAPDRGPITAPNPTAAEPREETAGTVRYVENGGAPLRILLDSIPPTAPVRLLFFQGRPAQTTPSGHVVTLDGAGGALQFDHQLRARRVRADMDGHGVASIAGAADGGYWIVTEDGEVLRIDAQGHPLASQPGPFYHSVVASDEAGTPWLVRSPEQQGVGPPGSFVPLFARLGPEAEPDYAVGNGIVPTDFLLTHLANAGRIAVHDGAIYYAPFIRDQVVAFSAIMGDTVWVASRGLPQSTEEPRFDVTEDDATIEYAPVNLGIAIGLDGLLYVLSIPGFSTERGRLDVFDPGTGYLMRTATLDTPLPTLAADEEGRVYALDPFALLTGIPTSERPVFQPFDLATLDGGRLTSDDLRGHVVLVNFWASWCAPCREEMPALDSLRMSIEDPAFQFITMNEDVNPKSGRAFVDEYGFTFPVVVGHGRLQQKYHYVGLPMTMVIDREGKVVHRWMGYAGHDQIQMIRAVVLAELERGADDTSAHGASGHSIPGPSPQP